MQKIIYPLSLLMFGIVMFLVVNYPESGRMNLIAGALFTLGITLNIVGYLIMKKSQVKVF